MLYYNEKQKIANKFIFFDNFYLQILAQKAIN